MPPFGDARPTSLAWLSSCLISSKGRTSSKEKVLHGVEAWVGGEGGVGVGGGGGGVLPCCDMAAFVCNERRRARKRTVRPAVAGLSVHLAKMKRQNPHPPRFQKGQTHLAHATCLSETSLSTTTRSSLPALLSSPPLAPCSLAKAAGAIPLTAVTIAERRGSSPPPNGHSMIGSVCESPSKSLRLTLDVGEERCGG